MYTLEEDIIGGDFIAEDETDVGTADMADCFMGVAYVYALFWFNCVAPRCVPRRIPCPLGRVFAIPLQGAHCTACPPKHIAIA